MTYLSRDVDQKERKRDKVGIWLPCRFNWWEKGVNYTTGNQPHDERLSHVHVLDSRFLCTTRSYIAAYALQELHVLRVSHRMAVLRSQTAVIFLAPSAVDRWFCEWFSRYMADMTRGKVLYA